MNYAIIYVILGILVFGFGLALYFLIGLKKQGQKPVDDQSLKIMMEWMKEIKHPRRGTKKH
jgi:hypothetical protein